MRPIKANDTTASHRRIYFHIVGTDGISPATGEDGGQPQISIDGADWTDTGIGTLVHIGNGRYYADLAQSSVAVPGVVIETRYKSNNTAEIPGDSAYIVALDPYDLFNQVVPNTYNTGTIGNALGKIGTGKVEVLSPVTDTGSLVLHAGDDYRDTDGTALVWSEVNAGWPDLTGATAIKFLVTGDNKFSFTKDAVAVNPAGPNKQVKLELTASDTAKFYLGRDKYTFRIAVSLANNDVVTLVTGRITVLQGGIA